MDGGYKQAKEGFVSGMTGSTITHINLISLVALSAVSLYAALRTRIPATREIGFFSSWMILIFPMLLAMTMAANYPLYLNLFLLLPTGLILRYPRTESGTPLPSSQPPSPSVQAHAPSHARQRIQLQKIPPLPALTTYRAHMMLMTVLAILAVDFPVFPRELAKCETFGVSLMDLGVGSFVFSQGVVSAIPLVKDASYLQAPLFPKLLRVTWKSLPIIALGLLRVLLVKGTEYPEHVTEYGVHWNFFITLAVLPVLQVLLHPLLLRLPISMVGSLVGVVQQIALSQLELREYVVSAPRTSLVSANKEGIVSLLGYLSIQLLGLSAGTLILPPTPSFFRRRQQALSNVQPEKDKRRNSNPPSPGFGVDQEGKDNFKRREVDLASPRQLEKTATELSAYAIMWWAFLGLARLTRVDGRWSEGMGVSRRMVNISYILWVAAFNVSFLLCYLLILDLWIFAHPPSRSKAKHHKKTDQNSEVSAAPAYLGISDPRQLSTPAGSHGFGNPPKLLEVVNRHGLSVFLLANVLTGLINLTMSTMYMSDWRALVILSLYSIVCCGAPWVWSSWRKGAGAKGVY
ncbi:hypothetical protein GALMADRAFT_259350 [Galerina marginata CBS 339.88]|uniref:GPI-anchored wall transfer protein n=1 Tax=Galerina marginata (strain CBS 339.88) TaxID=685588 RepID=A0A067S6U2_GALM3|nr:hypothetical protein GALMADRAFT_259350 [Galerina marginata CBS 339.88]